MKYYQGSTILQALYALPILIGAAVIAVLACAWQYWQRRGLHRAARLDGTVCLAGRDHEAVIRSALTPSLVEALLIGAFLGGLFNSAFSRWSPDYPFYYACTTAAYYPRCTGHAPAELIGYADLVCALFLAGALLGVKPILSRPKLRVRAWPGMVERRRWLRIQRFGPEECAYVELAAGTSVYYGAGHLVDLEKGVGLKVDIQLVLKDQTRVWLGSSSGQGSERRAGAAAQAIGAAIGVPVRNQP